MTYTDIIEQSFRFKQMMNLIDDYRLVQELYHHIDKNEEIRKIINRYNLIGSIDDADRNKLTLYYYLSSTSGYRL